MQDKVVYLTGEGKQRFALELRELMTVKRHEVEDRIRRAKEFSDTVDNAEYDEAKTEQSFVEGRILELERLLARDQSEAADLVERHIKAEAPASVYDALLLPALNYAERDRLEPPRRRRA